MPYVPQVDGPPIWVEDEDEANQRYGAEFGVETPERDFTGIADTEAEEKQKGGHWYNPVDAARGVITGVTQIPGELYSTGQQLGLKGMQEGGLLWGLATHGKTEQEKDFIAKESKFQLDALEKLGVQPDGSNYGLPSQFGILSNNNETRRKWLEPRSGFWKVGADITSVVAASIATSGANLPLLAGTSKLPTAYKIAGSIGLGARSSGAKKLLRGAVILSIKDLLPNAVEDFVYFKPEANKEVAGALSLIQDLPDDQKRLAIQALLAETDSEFSYSMKQLEEVVGGAIAVTVLGGVFRAGRKLLKRTKAEVKTTTPDGTPKSAEEIQKQSDQILDEVLDEEIPGIEKALEDEQWTKAEISSNQELGKLNRQFSSQTDEFTREFSAGLHSFAEVYLNKSKGSRLVEDAGKIEDLTKRVGDLRWLDQQIKELDFIVGRRVAKGDKTFKLTPELSQKIRQETQAKLDEYNAQIEANPIQYVVGKRGYKTKKRVPKSGWQSNSQNMRKYNDAEAIIKGLDDWDKINSEFGVSQTGVREASLGGARQNLTDEVERGNRGLRSILEAFKEKLNGLDTTANNLIDTKNYQRRLFEQLGRLEEIGDLVPRGPSWVNYSEVREIIEEGLKKDNWTIDEVVDLVNRVDSLHDYSVKSGGLAPSVSQAAKVSKQLEQEATQKAQKEAGIEAQKKATQEVTEEVPEEVAKAVDEVIEVAKKEPEKSLQEILEEQPVRQAPQLPAPLKPRTNKAGDLEVIAAGVPTPVDKKTFLSKLIRMAPKEQQAKIAFDRLKEAVAKVEAGLNIPLEERTTLNTVGDLINLLNLARVATEETVQKAIRDLDTTITFLADARPVLEAGAQKLDKAGRKLAGDAVDTGKQLAGDVDIVGRKLAGDVVGKAQEASGDLTDKLLKWAEDDMRRLNPAAADAELGDIPGRVKSYEYFAKALSLKYEVTAEEALENIYPNPKMGFFEYLDTLKERPDLPDDLKGNPNEPLLPDFGGPKGPSKGPDGGGGGSPYRKGGDDIDPEDVWGGTPADDPVRTLYNDPDDIIPNKTSDINNEIPTTKDGKVDNSTINRTRAAKAVQGVDTDSIPVPELTRNLNKDNKFLQKIKSDDDAEMLGMILAKGVEDMTEKAARGLNVEEFGKFDWFNTDTLKYTADLDTGKVAKIAVDILGERGFKISRHTIMAATGLLKKAAENPDIIDDLVLAGDKYAEQVKAGLPWIVVTTSLVEHNSKALLKASKMLQDSRKGLPAEGGYTDPALLKNFRDSFDSLLSNIRTVSNLFEGFGNGLRLMARNNRIEFEAGRPETVINSFREIASKWKDTEGFAAELTQTTKAASEQVNAQFDDFFKKVDSGTVSVEDWNGIDNLVSKVYDAQGDLTKLKELSVTAPQVLRQIQSGAMISSPMTATSIPVMGGGEMLLRQAGLTGSGWVNVGVERFIRKNTGDTYVEAIEAARRNTKIWKFYQGTLAEAYEAAKTRFLFGRGITDPGTFNKAAEIGASGLKRSDEIVDDLRAQEIKLPFTDYVLRRSNAEKDTLFDTLNGLRVGFKVFHDYTIAGEAWEKRGWQAKWLLAPMVEGQRHLPGRLGEIGTKSFYSGGEFVNMTMPFQFAALGDEFLSAWQSNAMVKALVDLDIDEKIIAGTLNEADRADEFKRLISKENKEFYAPVTAGLDDTVIGHQIIGKQLENVMEMTREVNRTEELTGIYKGLGGFINTGRYAEQHGWPPAMGSFFNVMAGVVTSPLNSIKWGIRYGTGADIYRAVGDSAVLGGKSLLEHLPEELQKRITQNAPFVDNLRNFESKYFSSDMNVRTKAQGALAVAVGMHSMAMIHMNDPELEITGGLENTYRSEQGQVGLYTMRVKTPWGGFRVPYRWIPVYGSVLAMQATFRDIEEFGNNSAWDLAGTLMAATANYVMETPGLASFDRIFKALEGARSGDPDRVTDFLSMAFAYSGEPYYQLRKFVAEGFDPRKPSNLGAQYREEFWLNNPESDDNPIFSGLKQLGGNLGALGAHSIEYNAFGFLTDEIMSIINGHPEGRDRRALWFGTPGETVNVRGGGKYAPLRAVFGRFMPFPDDLDVVGTEIVNNLIEEPKRTLYSSRQYNVKGVSKKVLNDFNHFLNEEFTYYDAITGQTFVGLNAAIKDLVESEYYQNLPGVDSPYASTGYQTLIPGVKIGSQSQNWDTKNNERRAYLQGYIRTLINKAKEDFMMGENVDQQYKAPLELKQYVLKHRRNLLTGDLN